MSVKHSSFIAKQLPAFIRDGISGYKISAQSKDSPIAYSEDYRTFIAFLEAYYEFLESSGKVYSESKKILSYKDVDSTLPQFEQYFYNEFLQYFPEESLTDKTSLIKFSRELYQRKSTPASFKFLFRALFNSDCDIYNTRESVLLASGGKWVRSKFIRLATLDPRFLYLEKYKLFGETSKSIAKVERSQVIKNKTEVFISDTLREFNSGEYVRVVDEQLNDILFDGEVLRAKIIGVISSLTINPNYKGLSYGVGDPVIFKGGTNPDIDSPIFARAEVGEVSVGSVKSLSIIDGSNGFGLYPNTIIDIIDGGGNGANAIVSGVDTTNPAIISYIASDIILPYANVYLNANSYGFSANPTANANTILLDAFNFISINTYPISEITLSSSGFGYSKSPSVEINSYIDINSTKTNIKQFGILSPIKILYGGTNYSNGDVITISGGFGVGAFANVKQVAANGAIEKVQYIYNTSYICPLGGYGYNMDNLPSASISSTNNKVIQVTNASDANYGNSIIKIASTANIKAGMYISGNGISTTSSFDYFNTNTKITIVDIANNLITISNPLNANVANGDIFVVDGTSLLTITSILGDGENVGVSIEGIGEIKSFNLLESGEDYISNPTVILKIMDVAVVNVNELSLPQEGELIYQGDGVRPNFKGYVESITLIPNQIQTTFKIRIYNYNGIIDSNEPLYIDRNGVNNKTLSFTIKTSYNQERFLDGILKYGDGTARANSDFINGTVLLKGKYLNEDGFLSSYGMLQSDLYNDFTYILTVEKEFSKYKEMLYNIIHPAGSKVVTRNAVKSNNSIGINDGSAFHELMELKDITYPTVYGKLIGPNKLKIYNLNKDITSVYLSGVMTTNTHISLHSTNNEYFYSKVSSIDDVNDIIYLQDYNILEYSNVAYGYCEANSNTIYITTLTGTFDLFNGGQYSNTNNNLVDIAFVGDTITIQNNSTASINSINYTNYIIYANTNLYSSGNLTNPGLISINRNFIANSIKVDYNLGYRNLEAIGNTATYISIDGFYITDQNDNLIYISTEI